MLDSADPSLTELLADPSFRQWVHTGAFRQPSHEWSRWVDAHPHKKETVRQAIEILSAAYLDETIPESVVGELVAGTWQRIERAEQPAGEPARIPQSWWRAGASVAATIALVGIGWWIYHHKSPRSGIEKVSSVAPAISSPAWTTFRNTAGKPRLLILPDSSSVMLLPGSTLGWPREFSADIRLVKLLGEAFFEVAKRPRHPFLVQTRELTTRVLGTSFTVRAYPNEPDVKVRVKNGKVAVYPRVGVDDGPPVGAITLLPDQQVVYNKQLAQLERAPAVSPVSSSLIQKASFEFNDKPVRTILDSIGRAYGLSVNYEAASLENCILTTTLTDVPLPRKLSIICAALGEQMRYELSGNQLRIYGTPDCM